MNILDFSDEILLYIVTLLDSKTSLINLANSCQRFDRLIQDRSLCSKLKFKWNLSIQRVDFINFLIHPIRASLITQFDIKDLYWIPSGLVRKIVIKLKNLKTFYAAGTQLSWPHLTQILNACEFITNISWSWDSQLEECFRSEKQYLKTYNELLNLKSRFLNFQHLLILVPMVVNSNDNDVIFFSHSALCFLISLCENLETLALFSWPKTFNERKFASNIFKESFYNNLTNFKKLKNVIISVQDSPRIYTPKLISKIIMNIFENQNQEKNQNQMKTFWLDHPLLHHSLSVIKTQQDFQVLRQLDLNSVESFSICLSENSLPLLENNKFNNLKKLLITDGLPRKIYLTKVFENSPHLESFCSRSFNCSLDWKLFCELHPKLKEVNLAEDEDLAYPDFCVALSTLKNLKKVSLPLYSLLEIKNHEILANYNLQKNQTEISNPNPPESFQFFKKKRTGLLSVQKTEFISGLDLIIQSCPFIEEFEIGYCKKEIRPGKIICDSLFNMKKWNNLKKLTLDKVPITSGKFLTEITKNNKFLTSIRLSHLGPRGKCIYINDLATSLLNCSNLKDFRLEQNYIGSPNFIFKALSSCPKLERLLIWSPLNDRPLELHLLENLIEKCNNLMVLYLTIGSTTKISCHSIRKYLESKFKSLRPPFSLFINNTPENENVNNYPPIHYRELVINSPQICYEYEMNKSF